MNKILIGLLIIGAAAGAFFFLRKKEKQNNNAFNKEWIVGEWKIDSISTAGNDSLHELVKTGIIHDSNYRRYNYEFKKDGSIVKAYDSTYTLQYNWPKEKDSTLTWKKNPTDSMGVELQVVKLAKDSLVLQTGDEETVWFVKVERLPKD
jgi:hypothetical protein